ncbi:protein TIFY 10a-like isoform X2 [Phalaenopsis equestris]|uniref:protein TIFY 10a-like isoform X2 n=1 Tax=Phalaenopsis equestris TaxID=78828 RepID=UPI0009E1D023|nr:protein TIFY 10a-like isoform X2 [Phalaenopsis equestris]
MSGGAEIERRPEKLSFSLTCNLFSQYIKEKGFPADLGLEMTSRSLGKRDAYRVPTTMNLLPGVEISGEDQPDINGGNSVRNSMDPPAETKKTERAQLTIFYGGKVMVFDNFPAEKADDLMQFANKESGMVSGAKRFSLMPLPAVDRKNCPVPADSPASFTPPPNFSDLPIARKASLHRFLEKRKDRLNARAPYAKGGSEGMSSVAANLKEEEIRQQWLGLGLGSQISSLS